MRRFKLEVANHSLQNSPLPLFAGALNAHQLICPAAGLEQRARPHVLLQRWWKAEAAMKYQSLEENRA
jgi:hypothetical protein